MPNHGYAALKERMSAPIVQANRVALVAVMLACAALVIALGAFSHGR
jgi:hypothetical protein